MTTIEGEDLIRRFVFFQESDFDNIIRISIAKHSDFKLEGISDARTLLHAKIIRDADKLDNCRVKLEDRLETFMNASAEETGASLFLQRSETLFYGTNVFFPLTE